MTGLLETLADETRRQLRERAHPAEDVDWPADLAWVYGWRAANQEYQAAQRDWGRREMEALLVVLGLPRPLAPPVVSDILMAAAELYLHTDGLRIVARRKNGKMRLYSTRCPVYERFADPRWLGLTACGCFARRKGRYDALGIRVEEEVVMTRKWGDPVCQVIVRLDSVCIDGKGEPSCR